MKLRNKKTGEIFECRNDGKEDSLWKKQGTSIALAWKIDEHLWEGRDYHSLAELNEEWEDAPEEPKGKALHWTILTLENFIENEPDDKWIDLEDCKQMLEKLKAWERLKEKGFKVDLWDYDGGNYQERTRTGRILFKVKDYEENDEDLDLLFGGYVC